MRLLALIRGECQSPHLGARGRERKVVHSGGGAFSQTRAGIPTIWHDDITGRASTRRCWSPPMPFNNIARGGRLEALSGYSHRFGWLRITVPPRSFGTSCETSSIQTIASLLWNLSPAPSGRASELRRQGLIGSGRTFCSDGPASPIKMIPAPGSAHGPAGGNP